MDFRLLWFGQVAPVENAIVGTRGAKVDEVSAADLFSQKCADDKLLKAALDKACQIPSRSVLFNIDQKAAIISNNDVDKLLTVFQSVFNEVCGYYKEGYIAQLKRSSTHARSLRSLQEEFERIRANVPGQKGVNKRSSKVTLSQMPSMKFRPDFNYKCSSHYQDNYKVSVEDFAKQVKAYIDRQAPGFRLNFFVDEVGQF